MKAARFLAYYLSASAIVGAVALVVLYPWHPRTWVGAILWVLAALPIWLLMESLGSALLNDRISDSIDPERSRISGARIAYALIAVIAIFAAIGLVVVAADQTGGSFIKRHFSGQW